MIARARNGLAERMRGGLGVTPVTYINASCKSGQKALFLSDITLGASVSGLTLDITGAARPSPPAIGA